MATQQSKSADYAGVNIRYDSYGTGSDALVFIHGICCDRTLWSQQEPLFHKYRSIVIDLPGHGESDAPETTTYTQEFFARGVNAVLQQEAITSAVLVGHSMGGVVSTMVLRLFSQTVVGIVYADSFFHLPGSYDHGEAIKIQVEKFSNDDVFDKVLDKAFTASKDPEVRARAKRSMEAAPKHMRLSAFANPYTHSLAWDEVYHIPAVHLATPQLARYNQEAWLHHIPQLKVKDWGERYGHFLFLEDPARFTEEVERFLADNNLLQDV